jgi:hypothetical protein
MPEDDVYLTAIVNKYFVQIPPCHSVVYHQRIRMGHTAEIDIPCIEGQWHVGPLCLNDEPSEGYMVYPSIVVFLLSFWGQGEAWSSGTRELRSSR